MPSAWHRRFRRQPRRSRSPPTSLTPSADPSRHKHNTMKRKCWLPWGLALVLIAASIAGMRACNRSTKVESGLFRAHRIYTGPRADLWAARFAPGDSLFAAACVDSTVYVWRTADTTLVKALRLPTGCTNLSFSADGRWMATSGYDGFVRLWQWPQCRPAGVFAGNGQTVWSLQFSPDGRLIAYTQEDGNILLRSVPSGQLVHTLRGHGRNVWDLAFSPDGTRLASGSFDATLRLWDMRTGTQLALQGDHTEAVVSVAWSADGRWLASASDDKTVRIRDGQGAATRMVLQTPEHQQGLSFSPDGKQLLSSGRDKDMMGEFLQNFFGDETENRGISMRLWDLRNGALLQTFSLHANDVNDVQFSRDGKSVLSAGSDKRVVLWKRE
ncbi:MAG: WD40 repeat domain-containing protein [Chitinophagaceae bacterium]|nr:MAG: WD40 repeat domain-containing protein [Chitinophagaceae bacterium]